MAYDLKKNFAISSVVTPPSPPLSGTALQVNVGEGVLFPAPPFNAVVFPANAAPSVSNAEIVRVTNKVGETFTIVRTQEGTSARSIQVGDRIQEAPTVRTYTDIEAYAGTPILVAAPVLEPGVLGQNCAGRVLVAADFTALLNAALPAAIYNLADVSDASGNGRPLTNKGAVPFASGIMGAPTEAALFVGNTAQALYVADTGAADPFRIPYGSVGCWFRTAKTGTTMGLVTKNTPGGGGSCWSLYIGSGVLGAQVYLADGTTANLNIGGVTSVVDDRWHHGVFTFDGTQLCIYVDGILDVSAFTSSNVSLPLSIAAPLNVGGFAANAATATVFPLTGRVEAAFVTPDVLSADQVRLLYAAKVAHGQTLYVPTQAKVSVVRQKKSAAYPASAFSATPLRLYTLAGNNGLTDRGSNGVNLANTNGTFNSPGVDGSSSLTTNAVLENGAAVQQATDAGLPANRTSRSCGAWFKTGVGGNQVILQWGTNAGSARWILGISAGLLIVGDGSTVATVSVPYADGQWHFAVGTYDDAATDGSRIKLYVDGMLVAVQNSGIVNTTLLGANGFKIGSDATSFFSGSLAGVFATGYTMGGDEVGKLYATGSQALAASPKNPGDHVEALDATYAYLIADTLESQHLIDVEVAA